MDAAKVNALNEQGLNAVKAVTEALKLSPLSEIRFYRSSAPFFCFTNFSRHPITVDGKAYSTTEHYFQAAKFIHTDPSWAEQIRETTVPREAFLMGRSQSHVVRSDWINVKDDVMRIAVLTKMLAHPDVARDLIGTISATLIEDSPVDSYWGCGKDGLGENKLGKILMEVRAVLSTPDRERAVEHYLSEALLAVQFKD